MDIIPGTERHVGKRMLAILLYVQHHPGCSKADAVSAFSGQQASGSAYISVDKCISAGYLTAARPGREYQLNITSQGRAITTMARKGNP